MYFVAIVKYDWLIEEALQGIVREAEDYKERVKDGESSEKSIEGVLHSWITENNYWEEVPENPEQADTEQECPMEPVGTETMGRLIRERLTRAI